jgi:cysteine-rich repeat protein
MTTPLLRLASLSCVLGVAACGSQPSTTDITVDVGTELDATADVTPLDSGDDGSDVATDTTDATDTADATDTTTDAADGSGADAVDAADGSGSDADAADGSGDTTPGAVCPNGVREGDEECDGDDLGEVTCASLGFELGTVVCGEGCLLDDSACRDPECGDGMLEGDEECDDGGAEDGDGCSFDCVICEDVEETPNDTFDDATRLSYPDTVENNVAQSGNPDFFRTFVPVGAAPNYRVLFEGDTSLIVVELIDIGDAETVTHTSEPLEDGSGVRVFVPGDGGSFSAETSIMRVRTTAPGLCIPYTVVVDNIRG